jgi:hypothetical protein
MPPTALPGAYNWADYFSDDYRSSLVHRFKIPEDGIDRDGPIVTKLLAWVARESGSSKEVQYEMTRHDAAVLLEQFAGCRERPTAADYLHARQAEMGGRRLAGGLFPGREHGLRGRRPSATRHRPRGRSVGPQLGRFVRIRFVPSDRPNSLR